jgi:hypothetical protein
MQRLAGPIKQWSIHNYVSDEDMWRRDRSPGNSAAMVTSAAT